VLFLPLQTCPGLLPLLHALVRDRPDTDRRRQSAAREDAGSGKDAFDYIASRPEIEDVVISGGDTYQLRRRIITLIGESLLAIPHVRRMRFATKGPAVMPMKILTDHAWVDALTGVVEHGRKLAKTS
jgi:lysine 2,3-aminomutase